MRRAGRLLAAAAASPATGPPSGSARAAAAAAGSRPPPDGDRRGGRSFGRSDRAPPRDRGPPRGPPPRAVRVDDFGDALPPVVANAAGEGAPGWTLLAEDGALGAAYWAFDAAGGRAPGVEANALLSAEAKTVMGLMADAG
jgi:hypothetical protein